MGVRQPATRGNPDLAAKYRQLVGRGKPPKAALLAAIGATLALVAAIVHWLQPHSAEAELADSLAGTRWYAVVFGHKPIGHYRSVAGRTGQGDFEFRTVLRFRLGEGDETRIEDRLVFARQPPYLLTVASHVVEAGPARSQVVISGGVAELAEGGETHRRRMEAALALREYLAVERMLAAAAPVPGGIAHARTVDFDQLAVVTHRWRILGLAEDGVELAREGREHDTVALLDRALTPVRMRIGELFELQRVADERTARAWRSATPLFASANHRVPVDGAIGAAAELQRLAMAVEADGAGSWPEGVTLEAGAHRPAGGAAVERARAATLRYPADDAEVRKLAARAVAGLDAPRHKADALTLFVHNYLEYGDSARPRTLFETLRDRRGDCTEFADLYTTLARAVGVPARTVVGLAYRSEGAFALHAWNEVAIEGSWRSVDPTWGQTRLAATHLPLPGDSALAAIAELPRLRFRVLEARYGLAYDAATSSPTTAQGEP